MVAWDNVSKGLSLSPEQRQNFLKLGVEVRNSAWQKAITRSDLFAGGNSSMPTPDPDLPELDLSGQPEQRLKTSGGRKSGSTLDANTAAAILKEAGGNKAKA